MEKVSNNQELPPEFIRPEAEQPGLTTFVGAKAEVPVVDFSGPESLGSWNWGSIVLDFTGARQVTEEYDRNLYEVVEKLLLCLTLGLGLGAEELKKAVGGEELIYNLKINYYPPCPRPDLVLGVPAHTDLSALTVLVPNQIQGLQVFRDQHWYDVSYIPNALIIHIGDQIEILSNGRYKAVLHRSVVNKDITRMSWPVFMEPPPHLEIGPLPSLLNQENQPKYKTKKFSDYAYCKLNKIPQ